MWQTFFIQILCGTIHCSAFYYLLSQLVLLCKIILTTTPTKVGLWFSFASATGQTILWLNFFYLVWLSNPSLLQLAITTKATIITSHPMMFKYVRFLAKAFMTLFMTCSAYFDYFTVLTRTDLTPYIASTYCKFNNSFILGLGHVLIDYRMNFVFCIDAFMVVIPVSLIILKVELEQILHETRFSLGMRLVRTFRRKIDSINNTLGGLYITFYVTIAAHYCELPEIMDSKFVSDQPSSFIIYLVTASFVWLLGAHFHRDVTRSILKWADDVLYVRLLENSSVGRVSNAGAFECSPAKILHSDGDEEMLILKLSAVRSELVMDPLGMSCCFFTITYKFLGSVSCQSIQFYRAKKIRMGNVGQKLEMDCKWMIILLFFVSDGWFGCHVFNHHPSSKVTLYRY